MKTQLTPNYDGDIGGWHVWDQTHHLSTHPITAPSKIPDKLLLVSRENQRRKKNRQSFKISFPSVVQRCHDQ
ncbi:hypothetical protein VNO78_24873 [Psophocarpus tetragonolobus]|uniref:Uncharacterized protein n=1 Tax=Psophocarpus tetragonolobus TaxID=3891 RepID=A0AAN9XEW3_PSOTE